MLVKGNYRKKTSFKNIQIYNIHHKSFVINCQSDNLKWNELIIHQTLQNKTLLFKHSKILYTYMSKYHYYGIDIDCFRFFLDTCVQTS